MIEKYLPVIETYLPAVRRNELEALVAELGLESPCWFTTSAGDCSAAIFGFVLGSEFARGQDFAIAQLRAAAHSQTQTIIWF